MIATPRATLSFLAILNALAFLTPFFCKAKNLDVCELFTQEDCNLLFDVSSSSAKTGKTNMPAGLSCQYTYRSNGSAYGLTIGLSNDSSIKKEGLHESAKDLFERQQKTRKKHNYPKKLYRKVMGLGDEAFWSGTALWVLKEQSLLIIHVRSQLKGSFTDREAAKQARMEQDLKYSEKAADIVLSRLSK